jgi:hypothetical protein
MIIGASHLTLSCERIDEAIREIGRLGFRPSFADLNLPNSPRKKPFLRSYTPFHGIALCKGGRGVPIELVGHGGPPKASSGGFRPIVSVPAGEGSMPEMPSDPELAAVVGQAFGVKAVRGVRLRDPGCEIWTAAGAKGGSSGGVLGVLLEVSDLSVAELFWVSALPCRKIQEDRRGTPRKWVKLVVAAPVPEWSLEIVLVERRDAAEWPAAVIDQAGFPCLAMLSTDLTGDCALLERFGAADPSGPFTLDVNKRRIEVELVRGPSQELIELIQVVQNNGRKEPEP